MNTVLSLWRSPLDKVALAGAEALSDRQPRCSMPITYGQDFSAMTVYNYGYYISESGATPDSALAAMLLAMSPSSLGVTGALAFIPQQSFPVNSQPSGFNVPDQCNVIGSGGGGATSSGASFFHFVIAPTAESATTFLSCSGSSYTSGGVYFRSLAFQWAFSSYAADTCIEASMWNVRAIRCTFTDCPLAFNASGVACALEQCTISYTPSSETGPNNTQAVILAGQQCAALGPGVFSQTSPGSGGATGCTCISVVGAEHALIADLQICEWTTGVGFSQTASTLYADVVNCEIQSWQSALTIAGPSSGSATAGIKVTSCTLAKASDSTDGNPIVTIGTTFGNLFDITLLDCTVFNMSVSVPPNQYGLEIVAGSNIKIIGGTYSNNSISAGAGIAITGSPTDVQIIGANLQPSYPGALNVRSQQYGLLISGTPGTVLVSGCDMTGYSVIGSAPIAVTGAPTKLRITNCPGYNDNNTPLSATHSQLMTGVSAATCTSPYYGPSVFVYLNPSPLTLHIFGQAIVASSGIFFLPSAYDSFYFISVPASFTWIGQ